MKLVFICSPYRQARGKNERRARALCRWAALQDLLPLAPHVYFTRFLDDALEDERERGLRCALELVRLADEVWVFPPASRELSPGMTREIALARELGKPIREFEPGFSPPNIEAGG